MRRPVATVVDGDLPGRDGRSDTVDLERIDRLPHDLTGTRVRATVTGSAEAVTVLDAAMRGADLVVAVSLDPDARRRFLDELARVADVRRPESPALDPQAVALLELLADGATTAGAARRLHLSTRSAYRQLAAAREVLGVRTNAQALLAVRATRAGGPAGSTVGGAP